MYMFYIEDNMVVAGSEGMVKVDYKSVVERRKFAGHFLGKRKGGVYAMPNYTQEMCEMPADILTAYIKKNGKLLAWR